MKRIKLKSKVETKSWECPKNGLYLFTTQGSESDCGQGKKGQEKLGKEKQVDYAPVCHRILGIRMYLRRRKKEPDTLSACVAVTDLGKKFVLYPFPNKTWKGVVSFFLSMLLLADWQLTVLPKRTGRERERGRREKRKDLSEWNHEGRYWQWTLMGAKIGTVKISILNAGLW